MSTHRHPRPAARRDGPSSARTAVHDRPFVVPVAALRRRIGSTRRAVVEGPVSDLGALGVAVPDGSPVTADLELTSDPGGVTASGTVTARWVGECRRCGGVVTGQVTAVVRERFVPAEHVDGDEDAYQLEDDVLDLEPMVRDAVLLELPLAPLCAETCLGLCPQCGTNWNESPCRCRPAADPRWAALDQLREPPG